MLIKFGFVRLHNIKVLKLQNESQKYKKYWTIMDTKEQIKQINLADRAVRVLSEGGHFRAVAVKNTMSAKTAQQKHGYSAEFALEHAKVLAFSSLLSAFLKGEERIAIDYLSETCKIAGTVICSVFNSFLWSDIFLRS